MQRVLGAMALAAVTACVSAEGPEPSQGALLYQGYCVSCHGVDARGTGPLAESLPVPPADLTVLSLSNDGVFPSSRVMAKVYGYPDQFRADIMPEFGPLLDGPSVAWTDETGAQVDTPRALLALHDYLKSIQTP